MPANELFDEITGQRLILGRGMEKVHPASDNVFKLRFYKNESNDLIVHASGKASVDGDTITLRFAGQSLIVGWRDSRGFVIRTLCRNTVPLYFRSRLGEVWISNDVAELTVEGETLSVRALEVLYAVKSSHAIKSVAAHLLEDICLLLPASLYEVSVTGEGDVRCVWKDVVFQERANSRDEFLELLIKKYRDAFSQHDQVCLALSGGYDSRFELAILAHLNKTIHCFHYERLSRERRLASRAASACGASFRAVPMSEAARQGWQLLHGRGYTTRWDGYFSAGTLPSAGVYAEMERLCPSAQKQLLMTGTLRGRLYDKADNIFAYWQATEQDTFLCLGTAFPEFQQSIDIERERRRQTFIELETKIKAKTDRTDVMTDISYHFLYRSVGKVATRTTFLIENGMPALTADQAVRDRFAALPIAEKRDEAFLVWAIGKLSPRLADLPWVSSSERTLGRQFGIAARLPITRTLLKRYRVPDIGDLSDWMSESDSESILLQLPELRTIIAQVKHGNARLYVCMILQFLRTLQARKKVSYRLSS